MNKEQLSKLETLLIEACDKHIANQGNVVSGGFSKPDQNGYCPISCLIGATEPSDGVYDYAWRTKALSEKLGFEMTPTEMWAFIDGFDGNEVSPQYAEKEECLLGMRLRQKYIGSGK